MKFQPLEKALLTRGYINSRSLKELKKKTGCEAEQLLPHLVGANILEPLEASYYAYGCEEFRIEPVLNEYAEQSGWKPQDLRNLFREFIIKGRENRRSFEDYLISAEIISEDDVFRLLAKVFNLSYLEEKDIPSSLEPVRVVTPMICEKFQITAIANEKDTIHIAAINPNLDLAEIEKALAGKVVLHLVTPRRFKSLQLLAGLPQGQMPMNQGHPVEPEPEGFAEDDENITLGKLAESADSIVTLINQLIYQAIEERASDIHFEPQENLIQVKFRIDGVLYFAKTLDRRLHQSLCGRIKVISALDTTQKRTPQDGRFKLRINGRRVDFRVSIIPCIFGESIVIRILDKMIRDLDLLNLGFRERDFQVFQNDIRNPYGMVLVSGPTGSGKTTTLYSAVTMIKTTRVEIVTIEDPVEYIIPGILQIAVNDRQGLTFSTGLRSIVRHDPDIIMVGEIRDSETAQIAVQASLTGHLVFSTIHCNNTIDIISRFANMGTAPYEFASAVNLLISQRLVRCLCPKCSGAENLRGECKQCKGRGFWGRTGIFEVLPMTEIIKTMILSQVTPFEILKEARKQGMKTLREAGLEKVKEGRTTLEEVNAVTMSFMQT